MRVCFVSLQFSPSVGGAQARAEKQARQLRVLGHKVTVVTLRHDKRWKRMEILDDLPVVRVGGIYRREGRLRVGRLAYLPVALAMYPVLWRLRSQYDLIHVFEISPFAAIAMLIGNMARKPVVISIKNAGPDDTQLAQLEHGAILMTDMLPNADFLKIDAKDWRDQAGDIISLPRVALGGQMILDFLMRSGAVYQCLSARSRAYLISKGVRPEQIVLIPGSVDIEKFRPAPERRLDVTKAERDIICVARLEYYKGIDVLLHAWTRIIHGYDDGNLLLKPRLRIIGEGALKPHLERLAIELCLGNSVEFLGVRSDVVDLLQQSWGFVLPSRWEGMPNALLEAMACGLPCVATRVSGNEDVIAPDSNGLLVESEQPVALAHALVRIMKDSDLAQRLGQEARATVVSEYQLTSIVRRCLELYRRLLRDSKNTQAYLPCISTTIEGGRSGE